MRVPLNGRFGGRLATLSAAAVIGAAALWGTWTVVMAPPPTAAQVQAGDAYLDAGDYRKAAAAFDQALAIDPDHRRALLGKARAQQQLGDLEAAERTLDRVIHVLSSAAYPDDAAMRGQLAAAYVRRGQLNDRLARYDRALADYIRSLTLDAEVAQVTAVKDLRAGRDDPAAGIRSRAEYLYKQLQLPEDQRGLVQPVVEQAEVPHRP